MSKVFLRSDFPMKNATLCGVLSIYILIHRGLSCFLGVFSPMWVPLSLFPISLFSAFSFFLTFAFFVGALFFPFLCFFDMLIFSGFLCGIFVNFGEEFVEGFRVFLIPSSSLYQFLSRNYLAHCGWDVVFKRAFFARHFAVL